ncbi:hypothetical protein PIB30_031379 [Stylosanthes scabra]|uniref:Uncharacterized protein n=1 Tax=Stylosanthes scabra TaxID=79078 RepID=A0ABU6XC10_9FABA|nr:hypothetical protein [Stylosanthes scabra]
MALGENSESGPKVVEESEKTDGEIPPSHFHPDGDAAPFSTGSSDVVPPPQFNGGTCPTTIHINPSLTVATSTFVRPVDDDDDYEDA